MEINASTLYSIGDTVYAVRYPDVYEDFDDFHYKIFEHKVVAIKVFVTKDKETGVIKNKIQYFLNGLTSYEGENWFDEEPDPNDRFETANIFPTREDAEAYLKSFDYDEEIEDED